MNNKNNNTETTKSLKRKRENETDDYPFKQTTKADLQNTLLQYLNRYPSPPTEEQTKTDIELLQQFKQFILLLHMNK
jgi:hypothetical protein